VYYIAWWQTGHWWLKASVCFACAGMERAVL
jgi:hypothetical protein